MIWADRQWTKQDLLSDPTLLDQVLREWRTLRDLVRNSPVHFAVYDVDDQLTSWNKSYEANHPEAFEFHRAEIRAGTFTYRDLVRYQLAKTTATDNLESELDQRVRAQQECDGTPVDRYYQSVGHMRVYKYPLDNGGVAGLGVDINDLIKTQEKLAKSQEVTTSQNTRLVELAQEQAQERKRLALAGSKAGFGIWEWDVTAHKHICDNQMYDLFGLERGIPAPDLRDLLSMIHPEDKARLQRGVFKALRGRGSLDIEIRIIQPDGKICYARISANTVVGEASHVTRMVGIGVDLTESRTLQEKLVRAQRLEAIGQLTGGIAHDFNNLLAVVMGNLELLRDEECKEAEQKRIEAALQATRSGAALTRNLLSFSRKAPLEPKTLDLNAVVLEAKGWMERTLPDSVVVHTSLSDQLWAVTADAASTTSALLNLIVNARDAMDGHGTLTLETANVKFDEESIGAVSNDLVAGSYVMLSVSDTGGGLSDDIKYEIFEPFFTTKDDNSGSGLGLSMVLGFMKQSGGSVSVDTKFGQGSSFTLYFPKAVNNGRQEDRALAKPRETNSGERILLVEDNKQVQAVVADILEKDGYRLILADSGDAAFLLLENGAEIDLLLTDIVMPGQLQGVDLARLARELDDDMPVVFMSGNADESIVRGPGVRSGDAKLLKPIRRNELLAVVAAALPEVSVQASPVQ